MIRSLWQILLIWTRWNLVYELQKNISSTGKIHLVRIMIIKAAILVIFWGAATSGVTGGDFFLFLLPTIWIWLPFVKKCVRRQWKFQGMCKIRSKTQTLFRYMHQLKIETNSSQLLDIYRHSMMYLNCQILFFVRNYNYDNYDNIKFVPRFLQKLRNTY